MLDDNPGIILKEPPAIMPTMRILELHELHRQMSTHLAAGLGEAAWPWPDQCMPGKTIANSSSLCNNYCMTLKTLAENSGSALSAVQLAAWSCLSGGHSAIASFPGLPNFQSLIAGSINGSMQIWRGKVWEIWSWAVMSGRQVRRGPWQRISKPFLVMSIRGLEPRAFAYIWSLHLRTIP